MPKAYTTGNGSMLVGFDEHGQVRDLYYPYVGQENHVGDELQHQIAVRVDGTTYFLADDFSVRTVCAANTLAGRAIAENDSIGITIEFNDVVYNERDVLIREITVTNLADHEREITVYFCQELQVKQTTRANTAYYDPRREAIIHYRGNRAFLINTADSSGSFDDYTTGVFGIDNKEGSYADAEDGNLSKNPVEHGPADSCVGVTRSVPADHSHTIHYWIACGQSIPDVFTLDQYVQEKNPSHLVESTQDFWSAWLNRREFDFGDLPGNAQNLFRRSLLVIRSHVGENGSIIASSDSDMLQHGKDTYSYVWPRDGTYIAASLDAVGDWNIAQRFYHFAGQVLSPDGYFMHKFNPDGSLGSSWHPWIQNGKKQLPIQEDETGTVLYELWHHYERSRDLEFIEKRYDSLIRPAAEFLQAFRDENTGLPEPSYDLWEEKYGVHTYTAASVFGGLDSAANIAQLLGKNGDAKQFQSAADTVRDAMVEHLLKDGRFVKGCRQGGKQAGCDLTPDVSTLYGLLKFSVFPPDHELVAATADHVFDRIEVNTDVGGFARYQGDDYYRRSEHTNVPGNPWFIATLWHARYHIMKAENPEDLQPAKEDILWVVEHARGSGILSEQVDPHSGEQVSAAPLVWSHGEYVKAVLAYANTRRQLQT